MKGKEQEYKKYNHAKAIRQQIRYVNDKMGEVTSEEQQKWSVYFNKVFTTLVGLDALLTPFKDDEYEEKLKEDNLLRMNKGKQISWIHDCMSEMMELCNRQNLFYDTRKGRTQV